MQSAKSTEALRPIDHLLQIMARLRGKDGCPWDREQSLQSLKPFLIEEAYEVIEAIDNEDVEHHREELGDLLLQVVFQAQIRAEANEFGFEDVARGIVDKLVRRHPHVFGDLELDNSDQVIETWNAIKAGEKAGTSEANSRLDGVPASFPALMRAQALQKKAAKVGFDWPDATLASAKLTEEAAEVAEAVHAGDCEAAVAELADLIFAATNCIRLLGGHTELAVERVNDKFRQRFEYIESEVAARGLNWDDLDLDQLESMWEEAKSATAF